MNKIIEEILKTNKTVTPDGQELKYTTGMSGKGGKFLYDIIKDNPKIKKTAEIGCAYGMSSLHICEALKDREGAHHTIIDAFQEKDWKNAGIHALKRAGLDNYSLIEERSEFALPALLKEGEERFDLIFVDGWHTLDHVMVDCFYSSRLLKTGGFLVMDDTNAAPIAKVAKNFAAYPCYKKYSHITDYPLDPKLEVLCRIASLLPISINMHHRLPHIAQKLIRRPNVTALQKIDTDKRSWYWYTPL
jgi:predicted O-methyltransferase YrrM